MGLLSKPGARQGSAASTGQAGCSPRSIFSNIKASLLAQLVKNPPTMQEPEVQSLGYEDPVEKQIVTHSTMHAWRIPW